MVKLERVGFLHEPALLGFLVDRLIALRSPASSSHWCWGYSFPWQTRTVLVEKGSPNLVCTCFVANALLDYSEIRDDARCLELATSAAEFILDELYWTSSPSVAGFSYPFSGLRSQVHNANFLAAALLTRVAGRTDQTRFVEPAMRAARYSAAAQASDGSWTYSELPTQQWIDNFHTGYNLEGLTAISRHVATREFDERIDAGLHFYLTHFFQADGVAKYFHNRTYPIDAHCVAHSLITLLSFADRDRRAAGLAESVFRWAMHNLRDQRGHFYYQVLPFGRNKVSYMRWTQAWMFLALATMIDNQREPGTSGELRRAPDGTGR